MNTNNLKDTYNYYTVKREFEKLYSDIIGLDKLNINDKTKQWELYQIESNKLVNQYTGTYNKLIKFDEIFSIGDKIDILFLMDTKQAIIKAINVALDTCTWKTEYVITVEYPDGKLYNFNSRACIHLSEAE